MDVHKSAQLSTSDIKLLRLFVQIVRAGGFTAAHEELDISMSAISTQMSTLEKRLGMRLCHRGRGGFRLTPHGRSVYELACEFETTVMGFRAKLGSLCDTLVGNLAIGLPDSIVTHPDICVSDALELFNRRKHSAQVSVRIHKPDEIEELLLADRLQVGISVFNEKHPELEYHFLASERHALYCGRKHPLFHVPLEEITREKIRKARYVARGYETRTSESNHPQKFNNAAIAYDMEAILIMLLSGGYIGHLPCHYALESVVNKDIKQISKTSFLVSNFQVAFRKNYKQTALVEAFVEDLLSVHQ